LGDVTADTLVDISSIDSNIGVGGLRLERCQWSLTGHSCNLSWEAAADVDLLELADGVGDVDFSDIGGITNNASLPTGNVVFTTTGFDTAGDGGFIVLEFKKKSKSADITVHEGEPSLGSIAFTCGLPSILIQPSLPGLATLVITGNTPTVGVDDPTAMGAPDALLISSDAPSILNGHTVSLGTLAISSEAPTIP